MDLLTFHYSNADILQLSGSTSPESQAVASATGTEESKYSWYGEPKGAWCWNEDTWCVPLYRSMKGATAFNGIEYQPAFK